MVKKTTKSKVTKKNNKNKKAPIKQEENSFGMMILVIIGIGLLIYFASNIEAEVSIEVDNKKQEIVNKNIIISGKTYSSKKAAMEKLKFIPQSRLTDEEIRFIKGY